MTPTRSRQTAPQQSRPRPTDATQVPSVEGELSPAPTDRPRSAAGTLGAGRRRRRALAVAAATLAGVVVWVIAVPVLGVDLAVAPEGGGSWTVDAPAVGFAGLVAGLTGWGGLALLELVSPRRGPLIWTVLAAVVLVLSLGGPLGAAVTSAGGLTLATMHVVVGACLLALLPTGRRGRLAGAPTSTGRGTDH